MQIQFSLNNNYHIYKKKQKSQVEKNSTSADSKELLLDSNGYYNKISFAGKIKEIKILKPKHDMDYYSGCILGGAIGDAIGAPVEFKSIEQINERYGDCGIDFLPLDKLGRARITDDTQMTLFTVDGLIKSALKNNDKHAEKEPDYNIMFSSYKDWYKTQCGKNADNGWISKLPGLHVSRGPGATCRRSLCDRAEKKGSIRYKINNINGNGGIMRVAPVGLMYYKNPKKAFKVGAQSAAITHGNPNAYLSAGFLAGLIANIVQGYSLEDSIDRTLKILDKYKNNEQVKAKIIKAVNLAKDDFDEQCSINSLGNSATGDGALAVSLYCALKHQDDFKKGVFLAVNHSGDSDTVGAITGNILGAYLGEDAIPLVWVRRLEMNDEISEIASDLFWGIDELYDEKNRYPVK